MEWLRSALTRPVKTDADLRLRKRLHLGLVFGIVAVLSVLLLSGAVPDALRFPAIVVAMLLGGAANAWIIWTQTDRDLREPQSESEKRERERRRKALGGP